MSYEDAVKISSQEARSFLKTAGATIRNLSAEVKGLREKLASHERNDRMRKLASDMADKGLLEEMTFEEKVAHLEDKDLGVVEEAIKMASPEVNFGDVGELTSGGGISPFETYIISGELD